MKKIPLRFLLSITFFIIAIIILWSARVSPYDLVMALWWPILTVLQFSLILLAFTSLPFRYHVLALGLGASVVPLITFLIKKPLWLLLDGSKLQYILSDNAFFGTINLIAPLIAPIIEEFTKVLPVMLIFFLLLRFKKYRLLSPIDFALLGLFAGAGFDIFENIARVMNGFTSMNGLYRSPVNEPLPSLFGIFLYPSLYKSEYLGNPMILFGHSGLAAAIALAFGWFVYLKKKRYVILTVLVYAICVFDHSMWNWYEPYPEQLWAKVLPSFTLYGRLIPIGFTIGLIYTSYMLVRNKSRFRQELAKSKQIIDSPQKRLVSIKTWFILLQRDNQLANAFRHYLKEGIKAEPFDFVVQEIIGKKDRHGDGSFVLTALV